VSAAREFAKAGFDDWLLFEQWNDRLGGRLFTRKMGAGSDTCPADGCPVEIGARYIQGIQRNPVYDLLKNGIGFRMHQVNYNKVLVFDENGEEEKKPPWHEWDSAFVCAEELGNELNQIPNNNEEKDGRSLLASDQCGWNNDTPVKDAIEWFDMEFEYGRSPEQVGAYAFPEYTYMDFRGFDYYGADERGLETIITHFQKDLEGSGEIRTGDPGTVVEIATLVDETECHGEGLDANCVKISIADGTILYAQWAISTIPFGVIKHNVESGNAAPLFRDATDDWKDVVKKFIMGGYHSTYLRFSKKFWPNSEFILSSRTDDSDLNKPVIGFRPHDKSLESCVSVEVHSV